MNEAAKPEDIAVALKYDGTGAPLITAKGKGFTAAQILDIARQNNIHIHNDPELVSLLSTIPLEHEIPRELYHAVAEVIAFAYFLSHKMAS